MTYEKPQVNILGAAGDVIELCSDKTCDTGDIQDVDPAYDLDE